MIRQGAERSLLLVIVSFTIAVVGTRWFLDLSGYPQVGGGELHIAHMLWGGLLLVIAAVLGMVLFLALDSSTVQELIKAVTSAPTRIERPSEALYYWLEVVILGLAGMLLIVGGIAFLRGHEPQGVGFALVGFAVALTAGALVSLYVEQITAMGSTLVQAFLLLAVVHYRNRFLRAEPEAGR